MAGVEVKLSSLDSIRDPRPDGETRKAFEKDRSTKEVCCLIAALFCKHESVNNMVETKETKTRAQGGRVWPLRSPRDELGLNGAMAMAMGTEKNQELHWERQIWNLAWGRTAKKMGPHRETKESRSLTTHLPRAY